MTKTKKTTLKKRTITKQTVTPKGKIQHVVPHDTGWAVKGEGNNRFTKICTTQKEAIEFAKQIAKNQNSITKVHGKNGQIRAVG